MGKEYERVRKEALLTNKEIATIIRKNFPLFDLDDEDEKDRKATTKELVQAQVDNALKTKGILVKSDDQSLPPSLAKDVLVKTLMLKPNSEGKHWVKVEPKRK